MKKLLSILLALTMLIPNIAYATEQESLNVQGETELAEIREAEPIETSILEAELTDAELEEVNMVESNIDTMSSIYSKATGNQVYSPRQSFKKIEYANGMSVIKSDFVIDSESNEEVAYSYIIFNELGEVTGKGSNMNIPIKNTSTDEINQTLKEYKAMITLEDTALIQKDKDGNMRGWCFLATMGMIANYYEGESKRIDDYADAYLNVEEVNKTSTSGSVDNGKNIITEKKDILQVMQVRGYRHVGITLDMANVKRKIDANMPIVLYLNRIDLATEKQVAAHTVMLHGYAIKVIAGTKTEVNYGVIMDPNGNSDGSAVSVRDFELKRGDSEINVLGGDGSSIYRIDYACWYHMNRYLREEFKEADYPQLSMEGTLAYIYNKYEGTNFNYENIFKMLKPGYVTKETEEGIVREEIFEKFRYRDFGETEQRGQLLSLLRMRGYKAGNLNNPLIPLSTFSNNWTNYVTSKTCDRMSWHMALGYTSILKFNVIKDDVTIGEYYAAVQEVGMDVILTGLYDKQEIISMPYNCFNFEVKTTTDTFTFRPVSVLHVKLEQ